MHQNNIRVNNFTQIIDGDFMKKKKDEKIYYDHKTIPTVYITSVFLTMFHGTLKLRGGHSRIP